MKNRLQNKPISRSFTKAVAVLTVLTTTSASFAQTPSSPTPTPAPTTPTPAATGSSDDARQHYERGVKLYGEEDYRAALIEFKRAYEISPNTAVLFNIGQSYYEILDYANALTTFEKYLAEGGTDIPTQRKAQVTSEVDELRGRVAHLNVTTNVPDVEILVDDVSIGKTPLAQPLLVSAGRRKIVAQKQGKQTITRTVEIAGGDKQDLKLDLADTQTVVASPSGGGSSPQPIVEPANRTPAWIALGVAAAGIGVGSVFGVLALGNKSNLDNACRSSDKTCPTTSQSDIDSLSRNATISTIGFAVGIVGIGVATYAFIAAKPHVIEPAQTSGLHIEPGIGPGSAGISGRF